MHRNKHYPMENSKNIPEDMVWHRRASDQKEKLSKHMWKAPVSVSKAPHLHPMAPATLRHVDGDAYHCLGMVVIISGVLVNINTAFLAASAVLFFFPRTVLLFMQRIKRQSSMSMWLKYEYTKDMCSL